MAALIAPLLCVLQFPTAAPEPAEWARCGEESQFWHVTLLFFFCCFFSPSLRLSD